MEIENQIEQADLEAKVYGDSDKDSVSQRDRMNGMNEYLRRNTSHVPMNIKTDFNETLQGERQTTLLDPTLLNQKNNRSVYVLQDQPVKQSATHVRSNPELQVSNKRHIAGSHLNENELNPHAEPWHPETTRQESI